MPDFLFSPTSLPVLNSPMGIGGPKCGACGLYKTCQSPKMPTAGNGKKKILILAEAPGKDEDEQNRQLVGRSGQELERRLRAVGINMREDCWLENAVICRPPGNKIENEMTVEYCRPNVINRVRAINPEAILVLGGVAIQSLIGWLWDTNWGTVARWAGYQIPSQQLNAWVCPTYHPSHILRERERRDTVTELQWLSHLSAFSKLKGRPWKTVPDYAGDVEPIFSVREAGLRLKDVTAGTVAFDYETNCLKPDHEKARIFSCSVCVNGKWTIAFPWAGAAVEQMRRILGSPRVKKIAQNAKFEDRWTRAILRQEVRGWLWDTMLVSHAMENATKMRLISSIKFQAFAHLGFPRWDKVVSPFLGEGSKGGNTLNRIKQIGIRDLLVYNGIDSLVEYKIAMKQMKEMGYAGS